MPRPTRDQILADLQGLSSEQQHAYMDEVEKRWPVAALAGGPPPPTNFHTPSMDAAAIQGEDQSATEDFYNIPLLKRLPGELGRTAVHEAPMIGGVAASLAAGPAGWATALPAAFLGGAAGEGWRETIGRKTGEKNIPSSPLDAIGQMSEQGAIQAAFEGGGRAIGGAFRAGATKLAERSAAKAAPLIEKEAAAANAEALRTAKESFKESSAASKLSATDEEAAVKAAHSDLASGLKSAQQQQFENLQGEADQIASEVTRRRSPANVGTLAKASAVKGAKLGSAEGERLYNTARDLYGSDLVNITPMKQEMARLYEAQSIESAGAGGVEAADLAKAVGSGDRKIVSITSKPNQLNMHLAEGEEPAARAYFGSPDFAGFNAKISHLPDEVSFDEARQLQKWIGAHLPGGELSANAPKSLFKHLWGTMSDTMEQGLAHNPEALDALKTANAHWSQYSSIFKRGIVPQLAKAYPEDFVKKIPISGVSRMTAVKEAILGQAARYGTPEEKAAAQEAWASVQGEFINSKILSGGISKLSKTLKDAEAILPHLPPEKIAALKNISAAVEAAEKVTPLEKYQARMSASPKFEAPSQIIPDHSIENIDRVLKESARTKISGGEALSYMGAIHLAKVFGIPHIAPAAAAILGARGSKVLISWAIANPLRAQILAQGIEKFGSIGYRALGPSIAAWASDVANGQDQPVGSPPPVPRGMQQ